MWLVAIRVDSGPKSMSRQKNPSGLISGIPAVYPERPGIEKKVYPERLRIEKEVYPAVNPDRFGLGKGVDTRRSILDGKRQAHLEFEISGLSWC